MVVAYMVIFWYVNYVILCFWNTYIFEDFDNTT